MQKILEPLEDEFKAARRMVDGQISEDQLEDYLVDSMRSLIFETLDPFPEFSAIIDHLENRGNQLGVSLDASE